MKEAPPDLLNLRETLRGLGAVWLFTFAATLVAVAVPWYLRALEVDLTPVAWSLFAGALVCAVAGTVAERRRRRGLLAVAVVGHSFGIVWLAFVWHLAGGLSNPVFAVVFALPVVGGGWLLAGWRRHATAALAVASPVTLAWMESSDLRWFALQSGLPVKWLADLLPELPPSQPFPGLEAPPGYVFTLVAVLTVLLAALAWLSGQLADAAARLERQGRVEEVDDPS